jgi:hypothetical protein
MFFHFHWLSNFIFYGAREIVTIIFGFVLPAWSNHPANAQADPIKLVDIVFQIDRDKSPSPDSQAGYNSSQLIAHQSFSKEVRIMDVILAVIFIVIVVATILLALFEYRIRQPDFLVLYESRGQISLHKGLIYPRHFSLALPRTTCPIQLTVDASAAGNLGVRVKLVGSVAPSLGNISSLIRVGGWNRDAVVHAADEVQVLLQGLVKEYTERSGINALASADLLKSLNERTVVTGEKFGVELISLAIQSMDPTDPEIAEALRQQEQARLLEQTEHLNQQARVAAVKARTQADEEITKMEHALDLKKAGLRQSLLEKESALSQQNLSDELARSRMRLAFEKEELEALKSSPELLMLTPQAARLAEASQNLKNARTVISLTPQDAARGSELLTLFQELLQKAIEAREAQSAKAES